MMHVRWPLTFFVGPPRRRGTFAFLFPGACAWPSPHPVQVVQSFQTGAFHKRKRNALVCGTRPMHSTNGCVPQTEAERSRLRNREDPENNNNQNTHNQSVRADMGLRPLRAHCSPSDHTYAPVDHFCRLGDTSYARPTSFDSAFYKRERSASVCRTHPLSCGMHWARSANGSVPLPFVERTRLRNAPNAFHKRVRSTNGSVERDIVLY